MSFLRSTDVSKHLARRPKGRAKQQLEPTAITHSVNKDLEQLTERLFAAVRGSSKDSAPGDNQ